MGRICENRGLTIGGLIACGLLNFLLLLSVYRFVNMLVNSNLMLIMMMMLMLKNLLMMVN